MSNPYLEWYQSMPKIIQQAADILPPYKLYKIVYNERQCIILSFEEPLSEKFEDVTVTIKYTGIGGVWLTMKGWITTGLKLTDIVPWEN